MGSAGNNAESQIHPLGQQQVGCGNEGLRIGRMIEHFLAAVVHVDAGTVNMSVKYLMILLIILLIH